jgi:hypothetical protein
MPGEHFPIVGIDGEDDVMISPFQQALKGIGRVMNPMTTPRKMSRRTCSVPSLGALQQKVRTAVEHVVCPVILGQHLIKPFPMILVRIYG